MRNAALGVLRGAAVGLALGVVARALMRLAAMDDGGDLDFTWTGSAGIALVFALAGAGAGLAGALGWRRWRLAVTVLLTSFFVLYGGVAIGLGEIGFALDRQISALRMTALVALALAIMALAVATPWLGLRLGRRLRAAPTGITRTER
ncbi:hypothetical protein GCM10027446_27150 [Angustibacter peucedani]